MIDTYICLQGGCCKPMIDTYMPLDGCYRSLQERMKAFGQMKSSICLRAILIPLFSTLYTIYVL